MTILADQRTTTRIEILICAFLCLLPLIATQMPRFLCLAPVILALMLLFNHRYTMGTWPKLSCRVFAWMIGLAALMGLSALWSVYPEGSLERALKTLPILLSAAVLYSMASQFPGITRFQKYFPIALAIAGTVLYLDLYAHLIFFAPLHPGAPSVHDTNNYAGLNRAIVFFMLCFFPALACIGRNYKTPIAGLLGLITALIFFYTDSQSAQVALLVGGIVYFLFPYRFKAIWIAAWGFLSAVLFSMPLLVQWAYHTFAAGAEAEAGWLGNSYASIRLEIWDFIARRAMEKPLTGFGADSTEHMHFDAPKVFFEFDTILHPHNFMLQLWIEYGVMGPLFASAMFGAMFYAIYRMERPAQRVALATMGATIVAGITSYDLWQSWWVGSFALLAMLTALSTAKAKA